MLFLCSRSRRTSETHRQVEGWTDRVNPGDEIGDSCSSVGRNAYQCARIDILTGVMLNERELHGVWLSLWHSKRGPTNLEWPETFWHSRTPEKRGGKFGEEKKYSTWWKWRGSHGGMHLPKRVEPHTQRECTLLACQYTSIDLVFKNHAFEVNPKHGVNSYPYNLVAWE